VSKENIHPAPASGFAFACAFGFGLVTPPDDFADLALALVVAAGVFAFAFFTLGGAGMGGGVAAVSGVPESASAGGTHLCFTATQCVHEAAILLVPALAPLPFWIQFIQACPLATQYVHAGTRGPTGEH
jgi:hypothetical protein